MVYEMLKVPVWAADAEVCKVLRSKLKPQARDSKYHKELEAKVLEEHHDAYDLYKWVMQ
jgi:hypothetical protein